MSNRLYHKHLFTSTLTLPYTRSKGGVVGFELWSRFYSPSLLTRIKGSDITLAVVPVPKSGAAILEKSFGSPLTSGEGHDKLEDGTTDYSVPNSTFTVVYSGCKA
jgi:hypothetical protein